MRVQTALSAEKSYHPSIAATRLLIKISIEVMSQRPKMVTREKVKNTVRRSENKK
jgi:hypothetical protein